MKLPVIVTFLEQGKVINTTSYLVMFLGSLVAVVFLLLFSYPLNSSSSTISWALNASSYLAPIMIGLLLLSIVLWGVQTYYYLRVNIDHALFRRLLQKEESGEDINPLLSQLDEALMSIGMIKEVKAHRSLEDRAMGALRLLKKQVIILISQWIILCLMLVILIGMSFSLY